jgi:hydrogenase maturation factor HypF (carbamoyltransferase family)
MKKYYFKFKSEKIFKVDEKADTDKTQYFVFLDKKTLASHFNINDDSEPESCRCMYVIPTKLGKKNTGLKEMYYFVMLWNKNYLLKNDAGEGTKYLIEKISDKGYAILSEDEQKHKDDAEHIDIDICSTFDLKSRNTVLPVCYSPFVNTLIDLKNPDNKNALSFGAERNFALSYLEDGQIRVSPLLGKIDDFYHIEELERQISAVMGHFRIKHLPLLADFNSYSFINSYLRRYSDVSRFNHLYSHLACTFFDNGFISEKGIGIVYDSVSYAPDGNIQGSEFVYGNIGDFHRVARWHSVPLPGGDIANIEPWRITIAVIKEAMRGDLTGLDIPIINKVKNNHGSAYIFDAINKGIVDYSLSTSMHHIISALGELLWFKETTFDMSFFETMLNEVKPNGDNKEYYNVDIKEKEGVLEIDTYGFFNKIISDIFSKTKIDIILQKVVHTIAVITADMTEKISAEYNEKKVFLSGEIFKNSSLLDAIYNELVARGFEVYANKNIPVDDSCVSVGQILNFVYQTKEAE